MQTKTTVRYLRIAPRKVRLVADLIRGRKVGEARAILRFCRKSSGGPLKKALDAAVASAAHNFQLNEANLYIAKLLVQEGATLKRYRPRARGRAYPIQKKTSHVTLVLDEVVPSTISKAARPAAFSERSRESGVPADFGKLAREKQKKFRTRKEFVQDQQKDKGIRRFFRRKAI